MTLAVRHRRYAACVWSCWNRTNLPQTLGNPLNRLAAGYTACMRFALLLTVMAATTAADAADLAGRVVAVHDGDTITIRTTDDQTVKIRLAGIDAPESRQPYGTNAKQALSGLVFGKAVIVGDRGQDRYGRTLGDVVINGRPVGLELVRAGMAWQYRQYDQSPELAAAEAQARAARRGLWADREPIPPWEWRASERERKAQLMGR